MKPAVAIDEGGAIIEKAFPGMTKPFAMIGILEKGYCDVKFVARSKGGHSSSPPKNTPFARLAAFVNYCETHTVFKPHMTPAALAMLKGLSSGLTGVLAFVTKHADIFKPVIVKVLAKTHALRFGAARHHDDLHHGGGLRSPQRHPAGGKYDGESAFCARR